MSIKPFPNIQDVYAIAIPFPVVSDLITVNVYVVGRGPLTLIDTGMKTEGTLDFIQDQLALVGFNIEDIERILITHGHIDHFGLVASIRNTVSHRVECFIHAEDKWEMSRKNFLNDLWREELENSLVVLGMPEKEIENARKRFLTFKGLADPVDDISLMRDGDEFSGDNYQIKVIHTPGHTPGTCCFYEEKRKILFSGDHIIKHITPNPLMIINREYISDPHYQSLKVYLESLEKLASMEVQYVFPGHGEYITDLPEIILTYKAHYKERMELVWRGLKKKIRPLYNIIDEVFPHVPDEDVFLAVSEILVSVEMLINEGRAELVDPGPPALFRAL
jgi:glyoxylase-like metal-dependent hydrolase (beta-lactamase superfamily II)